MNLDDLMFAFNVVPHRYMSFYGTIDISYLVFEFKKSHNDTEDSIYQLGMAMSTSIRQMQSLKLTGPEYPVLGVLIEGAEAQVFAGWTNTDQNVSTISTSKLNAKYSFLIIVMCSRPRKRKR